MHEVDMEPRKPDFLIIGSAKCGTTALASILGSHPNCCMSNPKEVSFFQDTIDYEHNPNFPKGWAWYKESFAHYNGEKIVGEATPSYSDRTRSPNTAKRIFEFNPHMKIIYMVRDPIERQVSGWKMQYSMGAAKSVPERREHKWALKGFEYWLTRQRSVGQWDECRYQYQIDAYTKYFSSSQIFISFLEDWATKRDDVIRDCCGFLGIDPNLLPVPDEAKWNRATDRRVERPLLKKVRSSPAFKSLVKMAPVGVRDFGRQTLVHKKAPRAKLDSMPPIASEFSRFVNQDCLKLLEKNGRPKTIWPSLQ